MFQFQILQLTRLLLPAAVIGIAVAAGVFVVQGVHRAVARRADASGSLGSPPVRPFPWIGVRISAVIMAAAWSVLVIVTSWSYKPGLDVTGGVRLVYAVEESGAPVDPRAMIDAVQHRVGGAADCRVRMLDEHTIEIVVACEDEAALDEIKARLEALGTLEFRILAHRRFNALDYKLAKDLPTAVKDVPLDPEDRQSEICARWVPIAPDVVRSFYTPRKDADGANAGAVGSYDGGTGFYTRALRGNEVVDPPPDQKEVIELGSDDGAPRYKADYRVEILAIIDRHHVTGTYLNGVSPGIDERGNPAVSFSFDWEGAERFTRLTTEHQPAGDGFKHHLAIILNGSMSSAPTLNSVISARGQISGYRNDDRGRRERDRVVAVLSAGQLPANLTRLLSATRVAPTVDLSAAVYPVLGFFLIALGAVAGLYILFRGDGVAAGLAVVLHASFVFAVVCAGRLALTVPFLQSLIAMASLLLLVGAAACAALHRSRKARDAVSAARRMWGYLALTGVVFGVAGLAAAWWLRSAGDERSLTLGLGVGVSTVSLVFVLLFALPTMLECAACLRQPPPTLTNEAPQ